MQIAAFTTPGAGYDQLNLGAGVLTLGGSSVLTLDLAGLTTSGTVNNLITYGSETGAFSAVNLIDNPNNFQAVLTYTASGLNVSIVAPATHFQVTGLSGSVTAGTPLSVTVTALDASNNVALLYTGTVQFTTTDPSLQAIVPANYIFTTGANGAHTFTGLTTLVTAGNQTVTATDTANSLVGTSGAVTITPATASQLLITTQPSSTATAGVAFAAQPVVAEDDPFGNIVNDSTHTLTAVSTGTTVLQGTTTLTLSGGVAAFSGLSYDKAETMALGFTTDAGAFTAQSSNVAVSPAAASPAGPHAAAVEHGHGEGRRLRRRSRSSRRKTCSAIVITGDSTHTVTVVSTGTAALQGTTAVMLSGGVAAFSGLVSTTRPKPSALSFTTDAGPFHGNLPAALP